jgi:hypothetical protein
MIHSCVKQKEDQRSFLSFLYSYSQLWYNSIHPSKFCSFKKLQNCQKHCSNLPWSERYPAEIHTQFNSGPDVGDMRSCNKLTNSTLQQIRTWHRNTGYTATEELPVDRLISHLIKSLPQSVTSLPGWQNASVIQINLYAFQVKGTVK